MPRPHTHAARDTSQIRSIKFQGMLEVTPKSWTRVMRQSRFEFYIGQGLTHSIFL